MTNHAIYAKIMVHEAEDQQEACEFLENLMDTAPDHFTLESTDVNGELLAAAKAAREMFYTLGDKNTLESKDCFELYEMLDVAIAKAEGRSGPFHADGDEM